MHRSTIEWTDYSGGYANIVWRGRRTGECECSPGCQHCYVTRIMARHPAWPAETTVHHDKLQQLARCKPSPRGAPYRRGPGSRPMVFVADTGDLFHERVPTRFIFDALDVMAARDDVDWQILTKRPERMVHVVDCWLRQDQRLRFAPPHIWFGASVEGNAQARRIIQLLSVAAMRLWISAEPLLEPLDIVATAGDAIDQLAWVVIGGESGADARWCNPQWIHGLIDQCRDRGPKVFVKQLGTMQAQGWGLDHPRGGDPAEWPASLRVREWPE